MTVVGQVVLPPLPRRGEIWKVALDPTKGSEIQKTRPCVVVSSDALASLRIRIVVPVTEWQTSHAKDVFRVELPPDAQNQLEKLSGADTVQIRCVALERFKSKVGVIDPAQLLEIVSAVAVAIDAQ